MKKIYITLVLVVFAMSSCEDFLDTEPKDKIALKQYINDESGLNHALAGVYDILGNLYGTALWRTLEVGTDEGYYARNTQITGPQVNNYDPTNTDISGLWTNLYIGIDRANVLIANINVAQMDEAKRQVILGEALFLRGYYYFILVSRFGDVPLKLTPTMSPSGLQIARTPSKAVYEQVLKDMKEAEIKVSASKYDYSGRISKTVVQGILARVYLQMAGFPLMDTAKYADALAYSKKVIDSGERGLNVSYNTQAAFKSFNESQPSIPVNSNNAYRQIFINAAQNIYDTNESIWEVEFMGNQTDGFSERGGLGAQNGITFTSASLSPTIGYSYGFVKGTARLFNAYDPTGKDLRRDWVLTTYTLNGSTGARVAIAKSAPNTLGRDCAKWRREYEAITPKAKNDSGINFPILRYADVLLMYAEAENQVNGPTTLAQEAVNKVRRRAYGQTNISLPYPLSDTKTSEAASSQKNFQLFIEDERMRELCFEGLRRMDLIRWNKYVTTMNSVGNEISTNSINTSQKYGGLAGTNTATRHLLFPIPSLEMMSNKLITENNPGW